MARRHQRKGENGSAAPEAPSKENQYNLDVGAMVQRFPWLDVYIKHFGDHGAYGFVSFSSGFPMPHMAQARVLGLWVPHETEVAACLCCIVEPSVLRFHSEDTWHDALDEEDGSSGDKEG